MLIAARRTRTISRPGESHCGPGKLLDRFHDSLPFGLTGAQHRCVREIRNDLAATRPMNRLLQGDVGAGKTLVALSAMLLAVEAGFQTVLMAPTQILAEQHYLVFKRWLEPLGLRLALRTGSRREETLTAADDLFGRREPFCPARIKTSPNGSYFLPPDRMTCRPDTEILSRQMSFSRPTNRSLRPAESLPRPDGA